MTHLKRLIAVFIIVLTAFLIIPKGKANSASFSYNPNDYSFNRYDAPKIYDDVNEFCEYTNTSTYLDNLKYSESERFGSSYNYDDKKITKIIPPKLFVERGTHFHIGIKYGFFVQTQKTQHSDFYRYTPYYINDVYNICEVFIFKINRTVNVNTLKASTTITPVLSAEYIYRYGADNGANGDHNIGLLGIETTLTRSITQAKNECFFLGDNYEATSQNDTTHFSGYLDNKEKYAKELIKDSLFLTVDVVSLIVSAIFSCYQIVDVVRSLVKAVGTLIYEFVIAKVEYDIDFFEQSEDFMSTIGNCLADLNGGTVTNAVRHIGNIFLYICRMVRGLAEFDIKISLDTIPDLISYVREYSDPIGYELGMWIAESVVEESDVTCVVINMVKDIALDTLNIFKNACKLLKGGFDFYETNPDLFGNSFGSADSKKYQLRYNDENTCYTTITNNFKYNKSGSLKNDTIFFKTTITLYDCDGIYQFCEKKDLIPEKKYYTITTSYEMKLMSSNDPIYIATPTGIGMSAYDRDVLQLCGKSSYSLYIIPKVNGKYSISLSVKNGSVACNDYKIYDSNGSIISNNFLECGKTYEIRVSGTQFNNEALFDINYNSGNGFISSLVQAISSTTEYSKTFYCKSTGYYYVEIDTHWMAQRNYILLIDNIQIKTRRYVYSGVYATSWSTYSGSRTQVTPYMWKVYLRSGEDYTINYSSNTTSPIKIYAA